MGVPVERRLDMWECPTVRLDGRHTFFKQKKRFGLKPTAA